MLENSLWLSGHSVGMDKCLLFSQKSSAELMLIFHIYMPMWPHRKPTGVNQLKLNVISFC